MNWLKKNWLFILGICFTVFVIYAFSVKAGAVIAAVVGFFGLGGGKKAVKEVQKHAKKKADSVGPHPAPGIDATERMEQRRKARGED